MIYPFILHFKFAAATYFVLIVSSCLLRLRHAWVLPTSVHLVHVQYITMCTNEVTARSVRRSRLSHRALPNRHDWARVHCFMMNLILFYHRIESLSRVQQLLCHHTLSSVVHDIPRPRRFRAYIAPFPMYFDDIPWYLSPCMTVLVWGVSQCPPALGLGPPACYTASCVPCVLLDVDMLLYVPVLYQP